LDANDLAVRLAAAPGDVELIELLAKGQEHKRLLQLLALAKKPSPDQVSVLTRVQAAAPGALRTVLGEPSAITGPSHDTGPTVAAAAAIAGVPARVEADVHDGEVSLPSLGTLRVPPLDSDGGVPPGRVTIEVSANNGRVTLGVCDSNETVDVAARSAAAMRWWEPLTRIATGRVAVLDVTLTTTAALRGIYGMPGDFCGAPADDWRPVIEAGWALLEAERPEHAAAIAAGVRTLVPVPPHPDGRSTSCTIDGVFGAVFLSLPPDPETFAVTLVHEFQHAKLSAALNLAPLHTAGTEAVYYAPWRRDPRPLGALLHGIYAHLAVAQFWDTHRRCATDRALFAHVQFARWRDDTWRACHGILGESAFTEAGKVFIAAVAAELEQLRGAHVPHEAADIAARIVLDDAVCWRLRNLQADPATANELAAAWMLQTPAELPPVETLVEQTSQAKPVARTRTLLMLQRTADTSEPASEADRLCGLGRFEAAADAYQQQIRHDPGDLGAWAGLAVSMPPQDPGHQALQQIPEVVAEIYRQANLTGAAQQSPLHLARWLTQGLPAERLGMLSASLSD
jgi:HEXXH motif-containing protein